MRIIGGIAGSRRIKMLNSLDIKPISDRVKQSLFEILKYDLEGSRFLDLFGGSGSVGIEALSRGAKEVYFSDHNPKCVGLIKENLKELGFSNAKVILGEAGNIIKGLKDRKEKFDIVFIDPPYEIGLVKNTLQNPMLRDILNENAVIIVKKHKKEESDNYFTLVKERKYGDTVLEFRKKERL
jgi:16S rRNA (guanine(966)-N(2))-methyltransferase RsmD